jgi:hypothetical protein
MQTDYERVVLRMKEHFLSKRSHGQDELLQRLARLEVECSVPEGQEGHDPTPSPRVHEGSTHEAPVGAAR